MDLSFEEETKLMEIFAEDYYTGIKDDFDDAFDRWLSDLERDEINDYLLNY